MENQFVPLQTALRECYHKVIGNTMPYNVGVVIEKDGNNPSFEHAWLDQITNHLSYNNVWHMKVSAPVTRGYIYHEFDPIKECVTYTADGLYKFIAQCGTDNFSVTCFYRGRPWEDFRYTETLFADIKGEGQWHVISVQASGSVTDWGLFSFTTKSISIDRTVELPVDPKFYSTLLEKSGAASFSDQERAAVVSKVVCSLKSDVNNIATAFELASLVEACMVPGGPFLVVLKHLKELIDSGFTKKAAKLWLTYRYQFSTTLSDIQATLEFYEECRDRIINETYEIGRSRTLRGGTVSGDTVYNCTFRLTPSGTKSPVAATDYICRCYEQAYVFLQSRGWYPSLPRLWDMVPLSFVVDWIVPIGDYLEKYDSNRFMDAFDIIQFGESFKTSVTVPWNGIDISIVRYYRHFTDPPSGYFDMYEPSTKTLIRRLIDSACLLLGS